MKTISLFSNHNKSYSNRPSDSSEAYFNWFFICQDGLEEIMGYELPCPSPEVLTVTVSLKNPKKQGFHKIWFSDRDFGVFVKHSTRKVCRYVNISTRASIKHWLQISDKPTPMWVKISCGQSL